MSTILLLYYRAPYVDEPELICACDSQDAVNKKIYQLRYMHPDAYIDINRFETIRVEHFKGVVTN